LTLCLAFFREKGESEKRRRRTHLRPQSVEHPS